MRNNLRVCKKNMRVCEKNMRVCKKFNLNKHPIDGTFSYVFIVHININKYL